MNPDQWFQARQGQSLLVPGEPESLRGQCVQAADYALNEVYGFSYHYGNASEWWTNPGDLSQHFDKITDGSIKKGDFVIYSSSLPGSGGAGHIDVAAQDGKTSNYMGYDSNWGGNKTLHQVTHNGSENQYILGSLRLKGADMATTADHDMVERLAEAFLNDNYAKNPSLSQFIGQDLVTVINTMNESAERAAWLKHLQDLENGAGTVLAPGSYQVK
jgi:hypothetical protein